MSARGGLSGATLRGVAWALAARFGGKALVFLSTIILARLLSQQEFGVAAYALIVIGLLDVMRGLGMGPALIFHDKSPAADETGFVLSLITGVVLFAACWAGAPLAADFFNDPRATDVTRILALTFPISALAVVHEARLQRVLDFERKLRADLANAAVKGLVSVVLAFAGFGPWSLIWGQLAGTLANTLVLWIVAPWRPRLRVDLALGRSLVGFGSSIIAINGLSFLLTNGGHFLVGRLLGASALGVYTLAFRLPDLLINQIAAIVGSVLFPSLTRLRDQPAALQQAVLAALRYVTLVTVPIGVGMALVAEPLVHTLFGQRWDEAVPILRIVAIYMTLVSLVFNIGDVFKAIGRPYLIVRLLLVRGVALAALITWAALVPGTLVAIAWAHLAAAIIYLVANLRAAATLLNLSFWRLLTPMRPSVTGALAMSLAVPPTLHLLAGTPAPLALLVAVLTGAAVYLLTLWLLHRPTVREAASHLRAAFTRAG